MIPQLGVYIYDAKDKLKLSTDKIGKEAYVWCDGLNIGDTLYKKTSYDVVVKMIKDAFKDDKTGDEATQRVTSLVDELLPMNTVTDIFDESGETNYIVVRCENIAELVKVQYVLEEPVIINIATIGLEGLEVDIPKEATHYKLMGLWERMSYGDKLDAPKYTVAPCNPVCDMEFTVLGYESAEVYREIPKTTMSKKRLYNNGKEQHYYIEGQQPDGYVLGKL